MWRHHPGPMTIPFSMPHVSPKAVPDDLMPCGHPAYQRQPSNEDARRQLDQLAVLSLAVVLAASKQRRSSSQCRRGLPRLTEA